MSLLKLAIHPGRILREEYLEPYGLSPGKLAAHIGVPRTRIERLVKEETAMTVDTAKRLAAAFRTTPNFWMNLQINYDVHNSNVPGAADIEPLRLRA